MQCTLTAQVGASSFDIPWTGLQDWKTVLNNAQGLTLSQNGTRLLDVELDDTRRWIAFQSSINGSPVHCVGYQETVGAIHRNGFVTGGSNRKVLAWLYPDSTFFIGSCPR